jgi:uncharacterized protein (DUF305 family)
MGAALMFAAFVVAAQAPAHAEAPHEHAQNGLAEKPFLTENDAAMDKMMHDMAITASGDVDRDFAAMMVPHHQGAVDMAEAELRYGHNEQLRRIAQEIIVDQLQEIAAMRLALRQPLPPSIASPTQPESQSRADEVSAPVGTTMCHAR